MFLRSAGSLARPLAGKPLVAGQAARTRLATRFLSSQTTLADGSKGRKMPIAGQAARATAPVKSTDATLTIRVGGCKEKIPCVLQTMRARASR
jgi:hypothetical protein